MKSGWAQLGGLAKTFQEYEAIQRPGNRWTLLQAVRWSQPEDPSRRSGIKRFFAHYALGSRHFGFARNTSCAPKITIASRTR